MGTGISMADINQIKQYAEDKEYDKALALIRQQDLSKSYNSQFVRICGEVFLYTHNYEECRNALLMAHKMAPESNRVIFDMIQLYIETGEAALAEKYHEQYVFNAPDEDSGLCELAYMFARSRQAPAEELYEALSSLHTQDRSDALSYQFMLIFQLMGDNSRFNDEYQYLFDNFRESEYKNKVKHLIEHKNAASELYVYPEESILKHDDKLDADETLLLEQDYYRMYPKEPEIVLMADDYDTQSDQSIVFKLTMDKWAAKRREKAEKRAAAKAEKKQARQEKDKQEEKDTPQKPEPPDTALNTEQDQETRAAVERTEDTQVPDVIESGHEEAVPSENIVSEAPEAPDIYPEETAPHGEKEAEAEGPVQYEEEYEAAEVEEPVQYEEEYEVAEVEEPVQYEEEYEAAEAEEPVQYEEEYEAAEVEEPVQYEEEYEAAEVEEPVQYEEEYEAAGPGDWSGDNEDLSPGFKSAMPDNMTELFVGDSMVDFMDGVPGAEDINAGNGNDVQASYMDYDKVYGTETEASYMRTDMEQEMPEVELPEEVSEEETDRHQRVFDEYDEMLKKEEAKLTEQFEREARLLQEAQSILASVESGVDNWNSQKVNNLFEAFDLEMKDTKKKKAEPEASEDIFPEAKIPKPEDVPVVDEPKALTDVDPVFENSFETLKPSGDEHKTAGENKPGENAGVAEGEDTEADIAKRPSAEDQAFGENKEAQIRESSVIKPHIELREHTKSMLTLDARKKDILQQLKERR